MTPEVSVIIPAHNAALFIEATLGSVQAQTYPRWEAVVADDGSTDTTAEVVTRLAESDGRIRLVSVPPPNGTAARARNTAMAAARGRYIALLDADDRWLPEKLERQISYLENHSEAQGVCCWYRLIGDESAVARKTRLLNQSPKTVITKEDALRVCPFQTSTLVFDRACFDVVDGMDESPALRSVEDYEFFFRLVARCAIHRIPEVLSEYRVQAETVSLSAQTLAASNERGWNVYDALLAKGFLSPAEARRKRGTLYYEQAKDNLFHLHAPFRMPLVRAVATGRPPLRAVIMVALAFLPAPVLRNTLIRLAGAAQ